MSNRIVIAAVCLALACLRPALAQRGLKDIPSPDPAAELAAMQVADGYEVNLFAADPLIAKPLQMNFDPPGRLWVSSSSVYPQIRPGEIANDTVTVLEDRDGDGRADDARGLRRRPADAHRRAAGRRRCYVANSTELLHLTDTDGDGKADTRRVVLSGFGTEDTHHIIHTFRWGPDCRLYFNQSIYIHSHVETPLGVRRLNAGGIWRFRAGVAGAGCLRPRLGEHLGPCVRRLGPIARHRRCRRRGINYGFPGAAYPTAAARLAFSTA
jgi:hypothetical protein